MIDTIFAGLLAEHIFIIDELGIVGKQIKKHIIEIKDRFSKLEAIKVEIKTSVKWLTALFLTLHSHVLSIDWHCL